MKQSFYIVQTVMLPLVQVINIPFIVVKEIYQNQDGDIQQHM